jgi:prepilin-type N-terminal cleavage/methylation domain-containing protein
MGPRLSESRGLSLVEILIVLAVVGVLASITVPALMSARRYANQASAVASLSAIADAQQTYASSCANGSFASRLSQLAEPPAGGGEAFLSPDLAAADRVVKSGYEITMGGGSDGGPVDAAACNGIAGAELTSSFFATAEPTSPSSGSEHYWVGVSGVVFAGGQPIVSTLGQADPPGARPVGNSADQQGGVADPDRPPGR